MSTTIKCSEERRWWVLNTERHGKKERKEKKGEEDKESAERRTKEINVEEKHLKVGERWSEGKSRKRISETVKG